MSTLKELLESGLAVEEILKTEPMQSRLCRNPILPKKVEQPRKKKKSKETSTGAKPKTRE